MDNDNDENGDIMITTLIKNFKGTCHMCRKKWQKNKNTLRQQRRQKRKKQHSRVNVIPAIRIDTQVTAGALSVKTYQTTDKY